MSTRRPSHRGFTLIELLVAIAVMALLAIISWRGIDGMARAQAQMRDRADAVLTLQSALSQWSADLDSSIALSSIRTIDWDGRSLRITRRSTDGTAASAYVVAWTLRNDETGTRWHRWQSRAIMTRGEWQQAWNNAAAWASNDGSDSQGSDVTLMPAQSWQVLYFRNDTWSPAVTAEALGTSTVAPAGVTNAVPDGVRLVIDLPPGPALAGTITRDWVRPTAGGAKL